MTAGPADHWERLYQVKSAGELSWYESLPRRSVQAIRDTKVPPDAPIIDVGGGASLLVDNLLLLGYSDLTVLDLAPAALTQSKDRLGGAAGRVTWIADDVTSFRAPRHYAVWHDRAVRRFLLGEPEQAR